MSARAKLLFSEAWRSLGANASTTVAATLTVLIGMFLLGLFIALGTWTLSWSNHVKDELLVKVYFKQDATKVEESALVRQLNQNPLVKPGGVKYVSKAEGFAYMKKHFPTLANNVPSNPLGDRIELRGFGVFTVRPRKTGIGRNPRTGAEVNIPPGKAVRFKPGKELQSIE